MLWKINFRSSSSGLVAASYQSLLLAAGGRVSSRPIWLKSLEHNSSSWSVWNFVLDKKKRKKNNIDTWHQFPSNKRWIWPHHSFLSIILSLKWIQERAEIWSLTCLNWLLKSRFSTQKRKTGADCDWTASRSMTQRVYPDSMSWVMNCSILCKVYLTYYDCLTCAFFLTPSLCDVTKGTGSTHRLMQ